MTPRSPDLAIFVLADRRTDRRTKPIALPLVYACGVNITDLLLAISYPYTGLVCVLFDPAIPTSTIFSCFLYLFGIIS